MMKSLTTVFVLIYVPSVATFAAVNLVDIHKNAKANAPACVGCHSSVVNQKSMDPKVKAFHPLHLGSPLLKFECVDCHKTVDVRDGSAAKLRKQVDPGVCKECHSPWPAKMAVSFQKMDCTTCHADWMKKMAKARYVNLGKLTSRDCLGCHGGRVLYSGGKEEKGG